MSRIGWRDHAVGIGLTAAYVAALLATSTELGMGRDESTYVDAAQSYAGWLRLAWNESADFPFVLRIEESDTAFDRETIDRYWSANHEHPSLPKSLFALSWLAQERWHLFPADSMAFRFPGMLLSGLCLWVLYLFGARAFGDRRVGLFAAASYALVPTVFYHSHLDAFDGPIVTMLTWVTYLYWRSLERPSLAILAGLAYGLCLETKHNAWILPLVLLVHFLFFVVPGELAARRAGARPSISLVPWWLAGFALFGPPIFVGLWPWLWHDTWARLSEYVSFHVAHVHYNTAFLGTTYFGEPGPMTFPWVLTVLTVPLTTLLLGLAGIVLRFPAMLPPGTERLLSGSSARPDRRRTDALLFGVMLAPMVVFTLPSTPIFGGNKHFLVAFANLALFAGVAAVRVMDAAKDLAATWRPAIAPRTGFAAALVLLVPSLHETIHSHPFGLSHYTWAIGGPPGGADAGMMRQFWGFTTGSLVPWLNENAEDGASVWICDMTATGFEMLHRDHRLRSDVRVAYDIASADYAIVHHEEHFAEVDYQIWMTWGRPSPVHVLTYDGVPIISVYRNPRNDPH